jgi:hypothetical protein
MHFATLTCALLILASCQSTQQAVEVEAKHPQTQEPPTRTAKSEHWNPPLPAPDDYDWIRHKNGEWLKGDIDLYRNGTIYFESDKMGDVDFDIEDIAEIRSPRLNSCLFEGDISAVGTLLIRDGVVLVGGLIEQRFDLAKLVTIVPGEQKESDYWSGSIGLSVSTRSGNTDSTDVEGNLSIERRTLSTLVGLEYTGNYGELEGEENTNNHLLLVAYQVFLSRRLFVVPLAVEGYRDPFQNIETRWTPSAGAGYYIFDRGDLEWKVAELYGHQFTTYESVSPEGDRRDETSALIAISNFKAELTSDVDLECDYSIQQLLEAGRSPNHHAYIGLSVELNDTLDLSVGFTWDRVGDPERDSDGNLPKNNDYSLSVGLEIDF